MPLLSGENVEPQPIETSLLQSPWIEQIVVVAHKDERSIREVAANVTVVSRSELNAELGDRVEEQVGEIERMGRLKRFLSPAVADTLAQLVQGFTGLI